ncbi:hypothetical protein LX36DRAFT_51681 [Colletotrichum falcatum]|nr:hypothetical protein LX36DRAFT_51681 [Colletotrichum falcatum]
MTEDTANPMVRPPLVTAAAPTPDMARPIMKTSLVDAQPHMTLPTKKDRKPLLNTLEREDTSHLACQGSERADY